MEPFPLELPLGNDQFYSYNQIASSASAFEPRLDTGVCSKSQPPSSDRRQMPVFPPTLYDTDAAINS